MVYGTVLFDLDGTLTDPKVGITRSVQYALDRFGLAIGDPEELVNFIGPPLGHSFRKFFGFSEEQSLKAIGYYREYFRERGIFENEVYRGIPEFLSDLVAEGRTLAVATSKPTVFAEQILEHFHLSPFFSLVAGSNLDNTRSDKGEVIAFALGGLGITGKGTVMVGDREHDVIGARKNGVDSVGVLYGYGSREEIDASRPRFTARTLEDLRGILLDEKR